MAQNVVRLTRYMWHQMNVVRFMQSFNKDAGLAGLSADFSTAMSNRLHVRAPVACVMSGMGADDCCWHAMTGAAASGLEQRASPSAD